VFPYNARERLIAMLVTYFDESYTHAPLVYTLAGYISTEKQWRKFQREWDAILKDTGYLSFTWLNLKLERKSMKDGLMRNRYGF
jgi:hypothetical protein